MQAIYAVSSNHPYSAGMPGGRPPKLKRSPFGERLCAVRQQRGYSQTQLAEMIGVTQQAYAGWERSTVALRPEDIASLAEALKVSTDELLGLEAKPKRKGGPVGQSPAGFRDRQQAAPAPAAEDCLGRRDADRRSAKRALRPRLFFP